MIGDTAELLVKLRLDSSGWTAQISQAQSSLTKLNKTATGTGSAFKAVAGHIGGFQKNIGRAFSDLGRGASTAAHNIEKMTFAAGALAVGGGVAAVKWAGDFQAQLQTINTIAFATPEALKGIGDGIRKVALDTGQSLDDLTGAYYDLLSAGVKTADAQSVLNNAVTLGIGGLATTTQTVDLLTTAYNAYGLTAQQTTQATDMFAQAIADGKVKADQISETFANVASVAKAYGVGINQIAASYGFLTAQGVPATEVTTEMNRAIISLIKPSSELDAAQKKLGVNFGDLIKSKGLVPALQVLRDYSDKTKIPLITLLGRIEAVKYALQTTGTQQAGFNAELDRINNSAGMAAKQAAERQQGLNYELAKLKAAVHDAGIEIGTALIPKITPLVKQLDDFLVGHREDVKRFAQDLANGFQSVAEWVSKINFQQIGDSLKVAASFGRGLIEAFLAAPQWLQTAVVTGWGLNKLTGGAVQNIMADLTKAAVGGVFQQFLARGAPGNPLYVVDVSNGLGGVAGKAALGLGVGGLAGLATITSGVLGILGAYWLVQEAAKGNPAQRPIATQPGRPGAFTTATSGYMSADALGMGIGNYQNLVQQFGGGRYTNQALLGKIADDLVRPQMFSLTGKAQDDMARAVAVGTERGIVHSGVFKKAQTIREVGGFKLSVDALKADLKAKTPLGTDALITAEAIALAQGNRIRSAPSEQNLRSAAYNLQLIKRLQDRLPSDLATKLQPKIASLEAAINRTTAAVEGVKLVQITQNFREGNTPTRPKKLTAVQGSQNRRENASGFLGLTTGTSDLGIAGEAGQEAVAILRNPKRITGQYGGVRRIPTVIHQTINVPRSVVSTRDVNAGQNLKRRYGPTYTQAGAG